MNFMSAEFVDTNILIYSLDRSARKKQRIALALLDRLFVNRNGALSIQVLCELCSVAIRRLSLSSEVAEAVIQDLGVWTIHQPDHADVLRACKIQRQFSVSWWDNLLLNNAMELGCSVLWTEDLSHVQRYGSVTARNPFRDPVH